MKKLNMGVLALLVLVVLTLSGQKVWGEELAEDLAKVRIYKYLGEEIDMPDPETREDMNLLVILEERDYCRTGSVDIVDADGNLIGQDLEILEDGYLEVDLPIGNYLLIDKCLPEASQLKTWEFEVCERHLAKGFTLECYNDRLDGTCKKEAKIKEVDFGSKGEHGSLVEKTKANAEDSDLDLRGDFQKGEDSLTRITKGEGRRLAARTYTNLDYLGIIVSSLSLGLRR